MILSDLCSRGSLFSPKVRLFGSPGLRAKTAILLSCVLSFHFLMLSIALLNEYCVSRAVFEAFVRVSPAMVTFITSPLATCLYHSPTFSFLFPALGVRTGRAEAYLARG